MDVLGFEKVIYHYDRIRDISEDRVRFPVHMTLSLGNYCNHKCRWCTVYAVQEEAARHMPYDKLVGFLTQASKRGLKAVGYVGNGEPTAYPRFRELVRAVNGLGIEQGMFTNGYLLDRYRQEVLDCFTYVRISLDAGSTEVHDEMHRVKNHFERIIGNVRTIIEQRRDRFPTVGIQYATHHRNVHDLPRSVEIAAEIGVDYFSVKPVFNWGGGGVNIEWNELTYEQLTPVVAAARAAHERRDFRIHYRPHQVDSVAQDQNTLEYDRCVAGFFNLNLYEDGRLVCCSPHRITVGTMDDDLDDIEAKILEINKGIDLSKCPPSCRYHALNHIVDTVINPERGREFHKNFL